MWPPFLHSGQEAEAAERPRGEGVLLDEGPLFAFPGPGFQQIARAAGNGGESGKG